MFIDFPQIIMFNLSGTSGMVRSVFLLDLVVAFRTMEKHKDLG